MSDKFLAVYDQGKNEVQLSGIMDEDMDLSSVSNLLEGTIVFDFKEVSSINSCGIRDWISFISPLSQKIVYRNCPKIIIEQMNMVKGFLPEGSSIESFYAPFFCESCENEELVLLTPDKIEARKAPTNIKCSNCGAEGMEFDALPQQYFHFLPKGEE